MATARRGKPLDIETIAERVLNELDMHAARLGDQEYIDCLDYLKEEIESRKQAFQECRAMNGDFDDEDYE